MPPTPEQDLLPALPDGWTVERLYAAQVRQQGDYALFLTDAQGRILTWNAGVERLFGHGEQEFIGEHARLIFVPEDCRAGVPESEMRAAAENGRAANVRWHVRKDGTRFYATGVLSAVRDADGSVVGFAKLCSDATARKRLEDALTRSNEELQQFAHSVSHDLQEPLRTVASFTGLIARRYRGRLDAEADELIRHVAEGTQRMEAMIRDLLAYSSLTSAEGRAESVLLEDDLHAAESLLAAAVQESGATITHEPLPAVHAERSQMVRLFQNLLSNAIKYRRPGVPPRIHVRAERQGPDWVFHVQDNGRGFPPQQAERIFRLFRRLDTAGDQPGTGVGLAVCRRIVEAHGGRMWATGQPGEGATFSFTLPAVAPERP